MKGVADGSDADITNGITLTGTNITFDMGASAFKALTVTATGVVDIDVNVTADVGNLSITGSSGDGDNVTIATGVTLTAAGNLTLANGSTDALDIIGEGVLNLTATGTVTLSNALDANGVLTITAATVDIGAIIDADTHAVNLVPAAGGTVGLGAGAGDFSVTNAELNRINTSGTLTIGTNGTTTMTISGWADDGGLTGTVVLTADAASGSVTFSGSDSSLTAGLTINADAGVTLSASLTTAGTTDINADEDNSGAGTFTLAAAKDLNTGSGALTITAADFALATNANTDIITTGALTLIASNNGSITLGADTAFGITNTELSYLNANSLTLGAGLGAITVKGVADGSDADITNGITLTGTNITFDTGASVS